MILELNENQKKEIESTFPDARIKDCGEGKYKIKGVPEDKLMSVLNVQTESVEEKIVDNQPVKKQDGSQQISAGINSMISLVMGESIEEVNKKLQEAGVLVENAKTDLKKISEQVKKDNEEFMREARELVSGFPDSIQKLEEKFQLIRSKQSDEKTELDSRITEVLTAQKGIKDRFDKLISLIQQAK